MWLDVAYAARKAAVGMATPIDLCAWAGVLRRWATTVNNQITAAKMRRLADDLERLAARKDGGGPPQAA